MSTMYEHAMYEHAMYERSNGIGVPYGEEDVPDLPIGVGKDVPVKDVPANVVSPQNSKSYMKGLTEHFRNKKLTPQDSTRIMEERLDLGAPEAGILEGNPDTGRNCCVRCDSLGGGSVLGGLCASYTCSESYEGECKWRSCIEPSLTCRYMLTHRAQIKEREGEHTVPKSVLIRGCANRDAQAEADNDRIDGGALL